MRTVVLIFMLLSANMIAASENTRIRKREKPPRLQIIPIVGAITAACQIWSKVIVPLFGVRKSTIIKQLINVDGF
jgi:hypothetical protein